MTIKFEDIEFSFDFVSSAQPCMNEAYLNIHTGETYWHSEFGDNEEELPDDIDDTSKYIALPHKNDLDLGKRLALKFSYKFLPEKAEEIETIFHKKGAYSNFKNILEKSGNIQHWYDYENKAQEYALREWCKINKIKLND